MAVPVVGVVGLPDPGSFPAILMIGAEFGTPVDWIRPGGAVATLDAIAAAHDGNAPVAVFADATGGFVNDTECVNGPRGNAADHLTDDVVSALGARLGARAPLRWGVVGFSSGGTCAVDLAVMHPKVFSAFVDVGGDATPNAGNQTQTVDRLFGDHAEAWSAYDPATVISRRDDFRGLSGLFAVPGPVGREAADSLCDLGRRHGMDCTVKPLPGRHDWPSAASAFAASQPWLADRLQTPGVASEPAA